MSPELEFLAKVNVAKTLGRWGQQFNNIHKLRTNNPEIIDREGSGHIADFRKTSDLHFTELFGNCGDEIVKVIETAEALQAEYDPEYGTAHSAIEDVCMAVKALKSKIRKVMG